MHTRQPSSPTGIRVRSVHCAGPFATTAAAMAEACVAERVHDLDVTGEPAAMASVHALGPAARAAGVMLLPGAGLSGSRSGAGRSVGVAPGAFLGYDIARPC